MKKRQGIDLAIAILIQRAPSEELDYGFVMDCLSQYASPRVKLNHLLKIGALIRVKKGLYILGKSFSRGAYSLEVLANKIYGPSYVSLEWALQYHRLIPERVDVITSVSWKRKKKFDTPLASFTYDHLPMAVYPIGVEQVTFSEYQNALVATKEKALADTLVLRRGRSSSLTEMEETLFEDLRIEPEDIKTFDTAILEELEEANPHSAVKHLIKAIEGVKR